MRKTCIGVLSLFVAGLAACEPAPAVPPPQPKPVEVAAPAETASAAPTGPDLSPVAEPADIVGIGRWRSPLGTVSNLASCSGVAPVIVEVNSRMTADMLLRRFIKSGDARKLASLVALDAPVDALLVLDAEARARPPHWAISIGLSSFDGAKAAVEEGGKTTEIAPGLHKVKGSRDGACGVSASAGQTPARLVCADREKVLGSLAPYLARTLPSVDLGGPDLHVEARLDVLDKRYGKDLRRTLQILPTSLSAEYGTGDARFDRLLLEAGNSVQEDMSSLLSDIKTVRAELRSASSGTCLRATAELELSGKTSWIAQTLTDRLDRSGPPPSIYWRQPKDSDLAIYGRGVDATRFTKVIQKLRELGDAALAKEGIGAADRKKITDLITLPYGKDTNTVMSHGAVNSPLPAAGSKDAEKKITEAAFAGVLGWTLIGMDQSADAMKKELAATVDAYKLASVQSNLKKSMGSDANMLPIVKSVAAPSALGAGSEALEITLPNIELSGGGAPDQKGPRKRQTMSLKAHVLLMPDGDSSWLAIGAIKDELVKRLIAAKTGASDKDQLAARGGLDSLRNGKQMWGGFITAAPFADKVSTVLSAMEAADPGWLNQRILSLPHALNSLPNRGKTPVFLTGTGADNAGGARLSIALDVQQGTFEDTRALAVSAYGFFSSLGLLP